MSIRRRIQVLATIATASLGGALLTSVAPATAMPVPRDITGSAPAASSAPIAGRVVAKKKTKAQSGAAAGRTAGATAGAAAGRKAGVSVSTAAAAAGAAAGRAAGAKAGAKAGRAAGVKGGAKAGRAAGRTAGAKAGATAGAAAVRALGPGCGSVTYYKANGTPWRCVFADNFLGTKLDSTRWRVMTSSQFNFGKRPDCFVNSPSNISVGSGVLTLTSRKLSSSVECARGNKKYSTQYTAAMVSTYQHFTQAYGRFEFRAKFPYTEQRGLQTSSWLWPDGANGASWPGSGEIDVAEWYSQFSDRVIPYLHGSSMFSGSKATNNMCMVASAGNWHTYDLDWEPGSITISYDGKVCLQNNTDGAPFNKAYFISMFQGFGVKRNAPTATTPTVASAQFDWVRVWS
jgi:beta-glucanase (GH16 family)